MLRCGSESGFFRDYDGEAFEDGDFGECVVRSDEEIEMACGPVADGGGEMKGVQSTETMMRRVCEKKPGSNPLVLIGHLLDFELLQSSACCDLPEECRGTFACQETGTLLDSSNRNQFDRRKFRDENEAIGFAENIMYTPAARLRMEAFRQCAGIEEVAQVLANGHVRERSHLRRIQARRGAVQVFLQGSGHDPFSRPRLGLPRGPRDREGHRAVRR